jgi:Na+-translocating ferredoxin:NAD+ oxidoreductase RnfG subunit
MHKRDYWREGYDAYQECDTVRERTQQTAPDDIQPRHREEWWEGWNDAAAEDPDNDDVTLRDQGIDFDQVH